MRHTALFIVLVSGSVLAKDVSIAKPTSLKLPGGDNGIGFDDLSFSPKLGVLAPAGGTGNLDLVDPKSQQIVAIGGFSKTDAFGGGHGQGTTSADVGGGYVFASDRGRSEVEIVDASAKKIVGSAKLAAGPDYVRWVESLSEVWVTEPHDKRIEYFKFDKGKLEKKGAIDIAGGPESLVIDATRKRANTHTWKDETVAIDLAKHAEVARWKNGCEGSRGIALDESRGLLFVGCEEGKAVALDLAHDGKKLGSVDVGKGVDIIAYSASLAHLYVPGGDAQTLAIVGVGSGGKLDVLGSVATADDASCVTADTSGHAYVCDPKHGALLVVNDPYAATK